MIILQASSPACTELEVVTLDWLGKMLQLPEQFLACSGGPGGGVIQVCNSLEYLPTSCKLFFFHPKFVMDGRWICDLKSFLIVFQSYQNDGKVIMKGWVQRNPIYN